MTGDRRRAVDAGARHVGAPRAPAPVPTRPSARVRRSMLRVLIHFSLLSPPSRVHRRDGPGTGDAATLATFTRRDNHLGARGHPTNQHPSPQRRPGPGVDGEPGLAGGIRRVGTVGLTSNNVKPPRPSTRAAPNTFRPLRPTPAPHARRPRHIQVSSAQQDELPLTTPHTGGAGSGQLQHRRPTGRPVLLMVRARTCQAPEPGSKRPEPLPSGCGTTSTSWCRPGAAARRRCGPSGCRRPATAASSRPTRSRSPPSARSPCRPSSGGWRSGSRTRPPRRTGRFGWRRRRQRPCRRSPRRRSPCARCVSWKVQVTVSPSPTEPWPARTPCSRR